MNAFDRPTPGPARPRPGPKAWWCVALAALASLGASDPDVVRVRVPSAKVSNWFPPGSDRRVLPYDRFEALVKAARDRPVAPRVPRPLKARHSARWESGRLIGRTELTVEAPEASAGPSLILLEPWSPALVDRGSGSKSLRATSDGRLALKVEPADAPSKVEFEWTLRARPGSDGRAFALDLPGVDVSSLALDLPAGLVPEASAGPRVGPEPVEAPGRASWRFEAARGPVDLRFRDLSEKAARSGSPCLWLEGTTTIDLASGPVNWRADWTLDESPGAPRTLAIGLDPGLEVVDVSGPRVAAFRVEPEGVGSKVSIRLDGEGSGASALLIRAICQVPSEGTWALPSARPLDATWTGGRLLVRLDAGRVLQSCVERSGRRVPPGPEDLEGADLTFESAGGLGPVADLAFRKPMADATVDVRGRLKLGDAAPRIDVALTWAVEKGRLLSFAADLPPGWSPDGVVSVARLPVPWHADPLGNGGTRVHMSPSPADEPSRPVTLTLSASAPGAGVTGPLALPRVRPAAGVRVADEVWVATADPGLRVTPILASGLAWLDPPDPPVDDAPTPWAADDLKGALAWRWLVDGAEARVDRTAPRADIRGEVKLEATIRPGLVELDWTIEVESTRGDLESVPILIDEPPTRPILWKSREPGGPIVDPRPLDEGRRASLGFPASGRAWDLALSGPSTGKIELRGRSEAPWTGRGRLPILTLPDRFRTRGNVSIRVVNSAKVKFDPTGLTPIEPTSASEDDEDRVEEPTSPLGARLRKAGEFGYRSGGGRLEVETTWPLAGPGGGLIREAFLVSQVSPGAGMRHRLTLGVAADSARSLALAMPKGVGIDRLRRDGLAVSPIPSGDELLVEIPRPGEGRPLCTLTIDYRTVDDPRLGPIEPHRLLPGCSMPCLGFAWEVVAPRNWALESAGRGLQATDPRPAPSLSTRLLGFHWSPWGGSNPARASRADAEALADLDRSASEIADGETNLGDWILKLDAGRRPLILDRLAIRSSGWGPGSRIATNPEGSKLLGPVRSVLEPMGLVAVPLAGAILITARDEVPDRPEDREAWAAGLRAVPAEDSDPTDRFQSASRWRGEATPRAPASGDSPAVPVGRGFGRAWRVVSSGWPAAGASVSLVDDRDDGARAWLIAGAVLVAGLIARGLPAKVRALGLGVVGALATVALAWRWPEASPTARGLIEGGLAVLAFWLGRSFRPAVAPATVGPSEATTTSRRSSFAGGIPLALALAVGLGVARAGQEIEPPILAVLPFDGPADPMAKPDRVVLLVKDHERLEQLARREAPPAVAGASLVSALHRVARDGPGLASVESLYEVEVDGPGPASWTFPVGQALELLAEVDDKPSPLAISPDGTSATLALEGAGTHRLRFRRLAPLSAVDRGGERARVPINRAAFARVAISAKGSGPSWVEVVGASGQLSVEAGAIEGGLGPLDALEVRWFPEDRPPAPGIRGPVDATFLWDASPVGDLIRMKMAHSDPEGASVVRLALEPGLKVRRHSIPNVVDVRFEGTEERPEWVAHVDPPLPRDVLIEVDFWRPVASGSDHRRWPEIDVPTSAKFAGLIGFRRPSDWSGRLEPKGGVEPAPEPSFLKAWGALPDDGLALAGAVRYARSMALDVETRPLPLRRSIRTRVVARPAPGRLNVSIEGVLIDRQGRSFDFEVVVPSDLRIVRLEADGLLDWRKVRRDGLRLQFDGSEFPERKIRIEGYLPAPADSTMSESRTYQAKVPWPAWVDAEPAPGLIEIAGPTRFQFEPGEGVAAVATASTAEPDAPFRSNYRVDRPAGSLALSWSAPAAKVNVAVDSELTIDPTTLTWTAALSCEVSGGPAGALNLNLPTEWARDASIEIEGLTHRLVSQAKGPQGEMTQWTIQPDSPIWGSARLVLRSRRPLRPGVGFVYPQVAPLGATGRGSVARYDLAILNVSGLPMEIAGSSGLQPVDISRVRPVDATSPHPSSRSIGHAYHVTGDRWSLRLKVGRPDDERSTPKGARVAFARLNCVLDLDGTTWGRARLDLEPRPGPFLEVRLPEGAEIPWASVEGAIGPAYPDGPGCWLVPLGDRQPRRVAFAWRGAKSPSTPGRRAPIALPALEFPASTTLISVNAPGQVELAVDADSAERIGLAGWQVETVEQLARRVVDALGDLDRSSPRDREAILEDLMDIELRFRHVSRLAGGKDASTDPALGRLEASLGLVDEASQAAGLEDLVREARVRLGNARPADDSGEGVSNPAPDVVRLRPSGVSHYFRATAGDPKRPPALARVEPAPRLRWGSAASWGIGGAGLIFWAAVGALVARDVRPSSWPAKALVLLALLPLLAWEPIGFAAALGLIGWGRLSG